MGNCTDCEEQEIDLCNGEKKYTSCVVSQYAVPTLNISANEDLSLSLIKIGAYIQELQQTVIDLQEQITDLENV